MDEQQALRDVEVRNRADLELSGGRDVAQRRFHLGGIGDLLPGENEHHLVLLQGETMEQTSAASDDGPEPQTVELLELGELPIERGPPFGDESVGHRVEHFRQVDSFRQDTEQFLETILERARVLTSERPKRHRFAKAFILTRNDCNCIRQQFRPPMGGDGQRDVQR